ncbi:MAG TPA: hypothetical protein VGM05_22115, partial [Planctomycetaceae bacterium]
MNINGDANSPDWWRMARHVTVAAIGVFFLSTIREGHLWGDDFAQYLRHADNIAHFTPYAETGYIYNPQNAIVGPRSYPPAYPVVLAPVTAVYGPNLSAYKALTVFLFLISLLIASQLFSNDLSRRNLWICLSVVGFSPVYWEVKDGVASEHLFLPLWYAALLVADDWYRRQKIYGNQFMHGVILGGLIFLACATRTVGIVLLPMIIACEVMVSRRVTRVGMCALATAVALLLVVRLILPSSGSGYLEQLQGISVGSLVANAYADTTSFSLIWQNGHWDGIRRTAGAGFALLAIAGFLRANVTRPTPLGIAMAGYFAVIVAWPSADGLRMILPLLPAFVFYLLVGINSLQSFPQGRTAASAGGLAVLVFSLASFGAAYAAADFGPISTGVESRVATE